MPSLAAKNARTVEMNRPAPGSSKRLGAKTASRRRDRPRQKRSSAKTASRRRDRPRKDPAALVETRVRAANERQSYIAGASTVGAFVR